MCHPGRPGPQGLSQAGSPGLAGLPEHEIHGVLFVRVHLYPCARNHVLQTAVGEFAVPRPAGDAKVHITAADGIGHPAVDQPLNDLQHLGDLLGGARVDIGWADVQFAHVQFKGADLIGR